MGFYAVSSQGWTYGWSIDAPTVYRRRDNKEWLFYKIVLTKNMDGNFTITEVMTCLSTDDDYGSKPLKSSLAKHCSHLWAAFEDTFKMGLNPFE